MFSQLFFHCFVRALFRCVSWQHFLPCQPALAISSARSSLIIEHSCFASRSGIICKLTCLKYVIIGNYGNYGDNGIILL